MDERTVYVTCLTAAAGTKTATRAISAGLMATIGWSRHSFASAAGDAAADMVFARLQQRIAEAPSEWSLDYVEHHQMMEKVA